MDGLLDLLDGIDILTDFGDLADAGINLADLLDLDELADLDLDWLRELTGLDGPLELADAADAADLSSGVIEAVLPSGEAVQFIVPSPETMPGLIEDGLASYPTDRLAGLDAVDFVADEIDGDGGDILGEWTRDFDGTARVVLYGHSEDGWETLHHEIGHHVVESDLALKDGLSEVIQRSGFAADNQAFLDLYSPDQQASEACAEAFAKFKANPYAFAQRWPELARFLAQRMVK